MRQILVISTLARVMEKPGLALGKNILSRGVNQSQSAFCKAFSLPPCYTVPIRDRSLLLPGRGPEDIFVGANKISWHLNFPSEIFSDPHSTAVIFHGPTLHVVKT